MNAYGKFMEGVCKAVAGFEPETIVVALICSDGKTMTCYFGANSFEKLLAAAVIQSDAISEYTIMKEQKREEKHHDESGIN